MIDNCERMVREIPGAEGVVIPGAGHMSNMDAPAAFDAALLEFLGVERARPESQRPAASSQSRIDV